MRKNDWLKAICLLVAVILLCTAASAENYSAGTMRLLRFHGEVNITDAAGSERSVLENARFSSGETMRTGSGSGASVSLDTSKIVSLDEITTVGFTQARNALSLELKEGALFLDVSEHLDDNETFDIETSTIVIGIRGTIVFLTERQGETVLGVLEGTAEASIKDGSDHPIPVSAGQMLKLPGMDQPQDLTPEDLDPFVWQQLQSDPVLLERVRKACPQLMEIMERSEEPHPAEEDWTYEGTVQLIAQSAIKLYDGTPLTQTENVLMEGLPRGFSYTATAGGSQTDAGESANPVTDYCIYNESGENVTGHFNVLTVDGKLIVDPLPIFVWTGSAEKNSDGMPLTNPEAGVRLSTGIGNEETDFDDPAQNDSEARYAVVPPGVTIRVTATGSQTEPGETPNTCLIEWGDVNQSNYMVTEELGTLHVHKPGKTLKFNYIPSDCRKEGSYTQAVRCELCGKTLSRQDKTVRKRAHQWVSTSEYFREETSTAYIWGHYEECSVCGTTRKVIDGTDPYD